MFYQIKDWEKTFENNRTRELKEMRWIPVPNKLDGDGLTVLLDHENAAAHFGAWIMLLEVASKCEPRGILVRESGKPHTPASLSRITRLPKELYEEVLERLVGEDIGWLATIPQLSATGSQDTDYGMEGNGKERKGKKQEEVVVPEELKDLKLYREDKRLIKRFRENYESWTKTFPHLDVLAEIRKAHNWEINNPAKRKKHRAKFIGGWLGRAQDTPRFGQALPPDEKIRQATML